jgi:hypothetical protein
MDQCSTIGAQRTGITFKLPVITFLRSMTCLASIEQKIVRTKQNSHRIHIQDASMCLLNFCDHRFRNILCNLDFRVCFSNLLQVGAFFDPDYLLVAWESRKIVLVNPPKIDHSAQHSVETNFLEHGREKSIPRLKPSDFETSTQGCTSSFARQRNWCPC